jgi:hypothetical protein
MNKYLNKWLKVVTWLNEQHGYDMDFLYAEILPEWWSHEWVDRYDSLKESVEIIHRCTKIPLKDLMEQIQ